MQSREKLLTQARLLRAHRDGAETDPLALRAALSDAALWLESAAYALLPPDGCTGGGCTGDLRGHRREQGRADG